jgi:hypothetical protein
MSERIVVLLIGLLAGLLLCCLAGGLTALSGSEVEPLEVAAPADVGIQADLSEAYLNRMMLENRDSYPSPYPIEDGSLDLQPGNRIGFAVQIRTPAGKLNAVGTITLIIEDGKLRLTVAEVRLGSVPVTFLMRLAQPALEARINAMANEQLLERTGRAKVKILAITTDDSRMHVFLAAQE